MEQQRRGNEGMTYFHGEYENDPYGLLAVSIVMQAIYDWRHLIRERDWEREHPNPYYNFNALRLFLRGDWCAMLLVKTQWTGERILELLEAELREAMQQPKAKGRKRKK